MARAYGAAGGSLTTNESRGKFGKAGFHGHEGEVQTARLLAAAFRGDPDVLLFHDLRVPERGDGRPERGNGQIDHIIVRGHRIIVLDSKRWRAGRIVTVPFLGTFRGWRRFRPADKHTVGMAVDRLSCYLPPGCRVRGALLVQVAGKGKLDLRFYRPRDGVTAISADNLAPLKTMLGGPARSDPAVSAAIHSLLIRPAA
jgi:hypothetical protein